MKKRIFAKVEKYKRLGATFICNDCQKRWTNPNNARLMAWHHARETRHEVAGMTTIFFVYNPKYDKK